MNEGVIIAQVGVAIFLAALAIVALVIVIPRKSYSYRKVLTDLYVAGRIRQLAFEDKIDLTIENETFKKYCKKQRIEEQDLDSTIAEDLQERITDKAEKPKK